MRKGDKNQREDFNVFKSKIMYYSYGMLQAIQEIVQMKSLLLKTASNVPFLQNACCNEKNTTPIEYFNDENESVGQYIKIIESLSANVSYVNQLSKAGTFFDPKNTKLKIRDIGTREMNEENIYAAMIYYCGLDRFGFIDSDFYPFFTEMPREYNKKAILNMRSIL
jgi:alpha-L-arabinofuranosidase